MEEHEDEIVSTTPPLTVSNCLCQRSLFSGKKIEIKSPWRVRVETQNKQMVRMKFSIGMVRLEVPEYWPFGSHILDDPLEKLNNLREKSYKYCEI